MPLRDDLLTPIPGSNPSGVALRYDPVTDKVKEARREDIEAPQGEWKTTLKVADHTQAIKLAGEALAKRGKDLQLAVWLVDSHIRKEGFAMLGPCFQFLRDLLDQFWDTIYPEIEDGDTEARSAPLEWLGQKLEEPVRVLPIASNKLTWVSYKESRTVGYEKDAVGEEKKKIRQKLVADGKITAEEFDAAIEETPKAFLETIRTQIDEGLESLAGLIEICDEKFGEYSPSFIKSRTALEEIVQFVKTAINKKGGPTPVAAPVVEAPPPPPVVEAAPVAAAPVAAAAPAPVAAQPPPAVVSAGGIDPADIDDAGRRLAAVARFLRKKDVYAIGPFLMLRGYRFGEIRYNGPQIDAKMLVAPPAELRAELKERFLAGNWDGVLETTEKAMELPCGRGWLDIQRYTVKALENKGDWFKFVADGVRTELRGLLTDLPDLLTMTLLDDTPTANPDTMKWIQEEVLVAGDSGGYSPPPPPYDLPQSYEAAPPPPPPAAVALAEQPPSMDDEEPQEAKDAFDKALKAARSGRLDEAVQLVSEALSRERTGRGRYKRRMQMAHLFVAAQKQKIAYPMLRELAGEIDRRQLEDWESGEVLAHPLVLLMQCMVAAGADEAQKAELYDRICRLDPVQALNYQE